MQANKEEHNVCVSPLGRKRRRNKGEEEEEEEEAALTPSSSDTDTDCETSTCDDESETIDTFDVDDIPFILQNSPSLPYFMRKAFKEEAKNTGQDDDRKLLIVSVHAVMLELGFICLNTISGTKIDGFHLPNGWNSSPFTISLWYSLPSLTGFFSGATETVVLKFQSLGKFCNIYGSLSRKRSNVYRLCLSQYRFVPPIDLALMKSNLTDESNDKHELVMSSYPESEVHEFRKLVKDGLTLPLLIDICEQTGLILPPCFMHLPEELKSKILGLLPAVDIAKIGCLCWELRSLSSNDDLWKQKYEEEFGNVVAERVLQKGGNWKERFVFMRHATAPHYCFLTQLQKFCCFVMGFDNRM